MALLLFQEMLRQHLEASVFGLNLHQLHKFHTRTSCWLHVGVFNQSLMSGLQHVQECATRTQRAIRLLTFADHKSFIRLSLLSSFEQRYWYAILSTMNR